MLKPLIDESGHKPQSTENFIDAIKTKQIPDEQKLASFDVKSMFTSIPLQLATDYIDNATTVELPLPTDDIMDLLLPNFDVLSVQRQTLQTATRTQLCFSRIFCAKHRGTSPSCYLYANYTSLVTLRWRHFHRRTSKDKKYDFYEHLNKHHADMQFGTKIQENCKIPLLDCLFTRDNKIIRLGGTTYRKATHTDRFTRSYVIVQPDLSQRLQLYGLWRDARN